MGNCFRLQEEINAERVDKSHFELLKVVGKGGFGKVNAVKHKATGTLMAMKRFRKARLIRRNGYVKTAWRERDVMAQLKSPFLVNVLHAFQDEYDLYLIMPFMQGGDLRYYLNTRGEMPEDMARYYAAEILLALEELHSKKILYRDLKPDNCLLDEHGHVRLSDFGLAVFLKQESRYMTLGTAGTHGYQAPEVYKSSYGVGVDVWAFGVLLYELLHRERPFRSRTVAGRGTTDQDNKDKRKETGGRGTMDQEKRKETEKQQTEEDFKLKFFKNISPEAKDLIKKLLKYNEESRIGYLDEGYDPVSGIGPGWNWKKIKQHVFFQSIDWEALYQKKLPPPYVPEANRVHCSPDHELQETFLGDEITAEDKLTSEQQEAFKGFEFNTSLNSSPDKKYSFSGAPPSPSLVSAPTSSSSASSSDSSSGPSFASTASSSTATTLSSSSVLPDSLASSSSYSSSAYSSSSSTSNSTSSSSLHHSTTTLTTASSTATTTTVTPSSTPYHSPSSSLIIFDPESTHNSQIHTILPGFDSLRNSPLSKIPIYQHPNYLFKNHHSNTGINVGNINSGRGLVKSNNNNTTTTTSEETSLIRPTPEISMISESVSESKGPKPLISTSERDQWRNSGSVAITPSGGDTNSRLDPLSNENLDHLTQKPSTGIRRTSSAESFSRNE